MFRAIDDEDVDGVPGGLELEPELLAKRSEQRCAIGIDGRRRWRVGGNRRGRRPLEVELERAAQTCVILDRTMVVDCAVEKRHRELPHRRTPGGPSCQPPESAF